MGSFPTFIFPIFFPPPISGDFFGRSNGGGERGVPGLEKGRWLTPGPWLGWTSTPGGVWVGIRLIESPVDCRRTCNSLHRRFEGCGQVVDALNPKKRRSHQVCF